MDATLPRRDFLKIVPGTASLLSLGIQRPAPLDKQRGSTAPRLSGAAYLPNAAYPIWPKSFWEIALKDRFWQPKVRTNAEVTIPFEFRKFADMGRPVSQNVLQAAIYSLRTHPDPTLQAQVDARIQELRRAGEKPSTSNGLFEVAAAYFLTTGSKDLVEIARRSADAIYDTYRRESPPFSGGERDAINCLELYKVTREKKYLDLAKHYLDIRGLPNSVGRSRHNQSYKPVLEQREAVGHAVNCASLMLSLVDVGTLTGIRDYFDVAQSMWLDAVGRKLYITGGIGSSGNEGFGEPYSLPNISAYAETCAALMFITFSHRMFLATGDGKYIDVMERAMYNNALSGVSASGDRFFYVNRLASAGDGRDTRWERASLECCPPNLVRFLASMPGYIYAQGATGDIYINLYLSSETSFDLRQQRLSLSVESGMPWEGKSAIRVAATDAVRGTLKLRIPGWARNRPVPGTLYSYASSSSAPAKISINGRSVPHVVDGNGYVSLARTWRNGDVVELDLPFETKKVTAHRNVRDDRRRMAVERGPIVYCAEWPDCEGGHALDLLCDADGQVTPAFDERFYGGATVLTLEARSLTNPATAPRAVKLIPYHLWANRGPGEMSVWLATKEYAIGDTGPAGGVIFYVNANYATDGWRYLEAAPVDQSAGAPWGCFRRAIPGARGTAVGSGKQNTAEMVASCDAAVAAAQLCANYRLNGVGGWFLPSRDELTLMYRNLKAAGLADFRDAGIADNFCYWASSQQTADMATHVDFADNGRVHSDDKDFPRRVRAIRAF